MPSRVIAGGQLAAGGVGQRGILLRREPHRSQAGGQACRRGVAGTRRVRPGRGSPSCPGCSHGGIALLRRCGGGERGGHPQQAAGCRAYRRHRPHPAAAVLLRLQASPPDSKALRHGRHASPLGHQVRHRRVGDGEILCDYASAELAGR
ncbi:hypothetical protein [Enterobacter vonholyi]